MSETRTLTRRQWAVIDDLFAGDLEETGLLEKHNVKRREYERWLADERFTEQLEQRIAHAFRQSRIILARNAPKAADKLVELTAGEKGETTRRACLDIIALHAGQSLPADTPQMPAFPAVPGLTPEMAGRLLAALARDRPDHPENKSPSQPLTAHSPAATG
jgi:hypothetical protein